MAGRLRDDTAAPLNAPEADPRGRGSGGIAGGPLPAARAGEDAFDRWLGRGLRQLYRSVVAEPIPEELLHLVGEHEVNSPLTKSV